MTLPLSIRFRTPRASHLEESIPRPFSAWTRGSSFIFDMAQTRGAPSQRRTKRQRASSTQVPSDSPSQAAEAPRIPPSEGREAIGPSSPTPQRKYEMRRPLITQGRLLCTPRVQYDALRPRGLGLQAQASHLELLSLRSILSYLLTCHQSRLSNVRWSRHRPLKATQIVEPDSSTRSYISIKRSCDKSLSSEMLTAYSRGTSLSTS